MTQENEIGLLIKQLNDGLEKKANNALRESGLTVTQVGVLMILLSSSEKKMTMKELEKHFGVSQPTMVGIISRLQAKDLVTSGQDPEDKRVKVVEITEAGLQCCRAAAVHTRTAEELIVRGFSKEEAGLFQNLLLRAVDNIKNG